MGISKSFILGEVTYASAQSGLTVFLKRLKALREFFESSWIYPKFFRPVAAMNQWRKPTEAELNHNVRVKRSYRELMDDDRLIVPKIEWETSLDPSVDSAMIGAITSLEGIGVQFSKTTKMSLVNRQYERELQQRIQEAQHELEVFAEHPELQQAMQPAAAGGGGGGGGAGGGGGGVGGGDVMPPLSPEAVGLPPDAGGAGGEAMPGGIGDAGAAPPPAASQNGNPGRGHAGTPPSGHPGRERSEPAWDREDKFGGWSKSDVGDLMLILDGDRPENGEGPWARMTRDWVQAAKAKDRDALAALVALKNGDMLDAWEAIEEWLFAEGYPPREVKSLEDILKLKGALRAPPLPESWQCEQKELESSIENEGDAMLTGPASRPR